MSAETYAGSQGGLKCPSCGAQSGEDARYCSACGSSLAATRALATQRRVVTTLFCDLADYTGLCERADAEDVDRLMRDYYAAARRTIELYGGTVEKFIGDAVAAVFGVPIAHEDDAERAVRSAIRIRGAVTDLDGPHGEPVAVRIGVNTGEAVVRLDLAATSGEGFLTGDAINTAARLQSAAPEGGILVGPTTYALTSRLFTYEELEPVPLKGKAEPTPVWLAHGAVSRTGADRAADFSTTFVGRDEEIRRLDALFDEVVRLGATRAALITGEPGIGKSRLVAEFFRLLDTRPLEITWRQGRCLPYGEGIAFWPLGEIVKAHAGILETDTMEVAERKLDRSLPAGPDARWIRARLRPLVGLTSPTASQEESFSAWNSFIAELAARRPLVLVVEDLHWADAAMLTFLEQFVSQSRQAPVLLVTTARTHFLLKEPGFSRSVAPGGRIAVPPLNEPQTNQLLAGLLGAEADLERLGPAIVERCGGNPLYTEELSRLAKERGLIGAMTGGDADLALPQSLHAVIAARIDALPPKHKEYLANAAVVGRHFWDGAVAALTGDGESLEEGLRRLAAAELIRDASTSSMAGQREFVFWHALTRDVAYGQLTREARAEKHELHAKWIEEQAGDRAGDLADLLAHHYVTALRTRRDLRDELRSAALVDPAVHYLGQAGDRALPLSVAAAESHYAEALNQAPPDHGERPHLLRAWAESLIQSGRARDAAAALREAAALLKDRGDLAQAAAALRRASDAHAYYATGPDHALEAEAAALEPDEPGPERLAALLDKAGWAAFRGDGGAAVEYSQQALDLAARMGVPRPARALETLANGYALLGDPRAIDDYRSAIELFEQTEASATQVIAAINMAEHLSAIDGPRASLAMYEDALHLAERRGDRFGARMCLTDIFSALFWCGRWPEAQRSGLELQSLLCEEECLEDLALFRATWGLFRALSGDTPAASEAASWAEECSRTTEHLGLRAAALVALATCRALAGARDEARALVSAIGRLPRDAAGHPEYAIRAGQIIRLAAGLGDMDVVRSVAAAARPARKVDAAAALGSRAFVAQAEGRHPEAADAWRRCADGWRQAGVPYEAAQAGLGEGRCLLQSGDERRARQILGSARAVFSDLGAAPALAEVEELLRTA